jgi:hypothetical protein
VSLAWSGGWSELVGTGLNLARFEMSLGESVAGELNEARGQVRQRGGREWWPIIWRQQFTETSRRPWSRSAITNQAHEDWITHCDDDGLTNWIYPSEALDLVEVAAASSFWPACRCQQRNHLIILARFPTCQIPHIQAVAGLLIPFVDDRMIVDD